MATVSARNYENQRLRKWN